MRAIWRTVSVMSVLAAASADAAQAASVKVYPSQWATVVLRNGKPTNVWPDGKQLAAGMWARHFWDEPGDAFSYLKFEIPELPKGSTIRRATFHGYVTGQYGAPHFASVWTAYLPEDHWTTSNAPFPFHDQKMESTPPSEYPSFGGAVNRAWAVCDVTACLRVAGEGPGEPLTLQLRRGLPGRRGWVIVGPKATEGNALHPNRPYLEIEYFDDPTVVPDPQRVLSRGEKWHRSNGLFFSGWLSTQLTGESIGLYRDLYPHAFPVSPHRATLARLKAANMPWVALYPPKGDDILSLPPRVQIGRCVDEDVLFTRDRGFLGRVERGATVVATLRKQNPDILTLVGLHAWNRSRGSINLTTAIDMDIPAGEVYPFLHGSSGYGSYFWQLTWARDAGQLCRKPYWIFTQTFGTPPGSSSGHCRLPSESELRLQIFAALTWGYQGFIDYVYNFSPGSRSLASFFDQQSEPTPAYHAQKAAIREAINLGRGLSQLRNTQVAFLKKPQPRCNTPSWRKLAEELPVRSIDCSPGDLTIGRFVDDRGHHDYLMLCNIHARRNLSAAEAATTVTLVLGGTQKLLELDRRTGKVVTHELQPTPDAEGNFQHVFELPGGTGTLLKLNADTPFALFNGNAVSRSADSGLRSGERLAGEEEEETSNVERSTPNVQRSCSRRLPHPLDVER